MTSCRRMIEHGTTLDRWSVNYLLLIILLLDSFLFPCCSARDTITITNLMADGETLVSAGERFELGFFTPDPDPDPSDGRRYIGIWYKSDPSTVVWVGNRGEPLVNYTGGAVLAIQNGNLNLDDANGTSYWSTGLYPSVSPTITAQLLDSGNLVLRESTILWQSFNDPTDTFLPGMKMEGNIELVSWNSPSDPARGNFTFTMSEEEKRYVIRKRSILHWVSKGPSKFSPSDDPILPTIDYMFSNFSLKINESTSPDSYSNKRVVMNITGEIQYWSWDNKSRWSLIWKEPSDRCSVSNACGNFGICNLINDPMCRCLSGFKPVSTSKWEAGEFSDGCKAESTSCENYSFLNYSIARVGKTDSYLNVANEMDCKNECDCQCQAYSYDPAKPGTRRSDNPDPDAGSGMCWIWREDLTNLQEEYSDGRTLYVRVTLSSKESTSRNCEVCGTMIVPYPLSSGTNCGDPSYSSFQCDASTNQLSFNTSSGTYRVSNIDPDTQKFTILSKITDNCDTRSSRDKISQLNQSLPFPFTIIRACSSNASDVVSLKNRGEIEIEWDAPLEPVCTSSADCRDWPFSTCNATGNEKGRCLCNANFRWDPSNLNCTQGSGVLEPKAEDASRSKKQLILIAVVTVMSVSILACATIVYIWRRNVRGQGNVAIQRNRFDSERHAKDLIEMSEFKEEDRKGIDVPFFELESILAATDNFSDANKLGQGGYGPVYKGTFPGGQEIAVKRLSSVSGQGLHEFKNEVVLIAKLQHRNLVKLWGYCVRGDEKILIYEYMPNRSLDAFIFDSELGASLDWEMRFNIILGIARGLLYLHQDSRLRIIHRDMKTSNILLDAEMNPKISDFGLARIVGGKQDEANTNRVVGTYGYMAPEYALDGIFSVKSDVFSFGVVMLEIISGKRNTGFYKSHEALSLLGYAWRYWEEGDAWKLMDQTLEQSCNRSEFMKCVNVGLLCVQEDPNDRPDIATLIMMLGSESANLASPKQPAFVARTTPSTSGVASSSATKTETRTDLTNSFVEGR